MLVFLFLHPLTGARTDYLSSIRRLSSTAAVAMLDADCEEEIALDTDVDDDFDCVSMADSAVSSSAESVVSVSACSISVVDMVCHYHSTGCHAR